jgi:hypothetical protein
MRQEFKRKGNALDGKRKPMKMKFLRLGNWGYKSWVSVGLRMMEEEMSVR